MKLSVSLVIVTIDRADSLDRTLTSLGQIRYDNFEVIVVHGPCSDHTAQVIARHAAGLRAYSTDKCNISISRNIGLAHARGEVVAFIDDDAIPEPDWLDRLMQPYADPGVVTVGGFIRDADGFAFQARYTVADRYGDTLAFAHAGDFRLEGESFLSLTGTNFSGRRDALIKIGGFDEEYIWFLDETDLNLRMHDAGLGFAVAPEAEIHHKYEAGFTRTRAAAPRTMYPQLRSKAYFCVKHNLGRRPLSDILAYLADYTAKERAWKRALVHEGVERADVERLIHEVERGVDDGIADALRLPAPALLSPELRRSAAGDLFTRRRPQLATDKRLRLCLFSREYPPTGHGGIGQWTREVATGLAARGHEVTVIARALDGRPNIDFVEGVWVHRIGVAPIAAADAAAFAPAPASLAAYALALHREFERIDGHRRFHLISGPIADLEPMASLALAPIPVVVSLHTTYKLSLPHKPDWLSRPDYIAGHVEPAIACERGLIAEAGRLLANSRAILDDIEAAHELTIDRAKTTIIPHGVRDMAARSPRRAGVGGGVALLFVGRLEPRKGADALLAILPDLLEAHPTLTADIVGDDDILVDGQTLRRRFEADNAGRPEVLRRTRFAGALPRAEVEAHYAAADIFVAPSKYESFGLIFIEAMCFGKPVVAYDVGGAAELIENGVDGVLVASGEPAKLSHAIGRLVEDPVLREEIGRRARKTYEAKYTADLMIDRLEAFYRSVLAERRPEAERLRA